MTGSEEPKDWKYSSPDAAGLHEVISPANSACRETWIYRLNLDARESYTLQSAKHEMNIVVIAGKVSVRHASVTETLSERDAFYLPGESSVQVIAQEKLVLFIGAAMYEGTGSFFIRKYDLSLPLGDIHQVHGKPPYKREVFMTLAAQDKASRLICGITEGEEGKWTSWPPHQHTAHLEEVYCYFNLDKPKFALHLASRIPGEVEFVHVVSSGDFVIVPEGYHPTVGMPGARSCYFWVMSAFAQESRRYDLAVNDPNFEK